MSTDGGMDEEDVVHIHHAISLSQRKEYKGGICSNMDRPRDFHTSWSKSDTENQIYDIAFMWNLKERVQMNLITKQ